MKSILQVIQELIKPYIDKIAKNIAPVEVSPSEHSYTVGKSLIFKGVMYKVTSAIAVNDELEVGVNIIADTDILTKFSNKLYTYTADATAWDTAPTENSTKPVTSGGVYQAISSVSIDDMTGATSSADGEHGLVPAPLIADREKFLKGDGTWSGEIGDEISDIVNVLGAKNLLSNKASSQINNGITWTVNSLGSVTANGTATTLSVIYLNSKITLKKGTYKISGTPAGGDYTTSYAMIVSNVSTSTVIATDAPNAPSGVTDTFTVTNESEEYSSYIIIRTGVTVNNVNFYPMIRPASIKDDTYIPYVSTNKELTDWVLVDPVKSIQGSLNGTKPEFYKKGKTLVMTSFPHPNAIGTAISITLKPEYKFRRSQAFMVVNYTAWIGSYQDSNQYVLNSSTNTISASTAPEKNYYMLYSPVVFILQ